MYQVGDLYSPQKDDKQFDTENDAIDYALHASDDDSAWGIWDLSNDAELIFIFYQGNAFKAW